MLGMKIGSRTTRIASLGLILIFFLFGAAAPAAQTGQAPLKILISNDDGITAPGIAALFEKLLPLGRVSVAAPSRNFSAVGHSLTFRVAIPVKTTEKKGMIWFAIGASPATCVRLALKTLLPEKPDIVVSGINRGDNLGVMTFSSGTAACAREASYYGIPAAAFSLQEGEDMDYDGAAEIAAGIVRELAGWNPGPGVFLNVNIPALPKNKIKGILITRQDTQAPAEYYQSEDSADGQKYFRSVYVPVKNGAERTDVRALAEGYVSITPFSFDQTAEAALKKLENLNIALK